MFQKRLFKALSLAREMVAKATHTHSVLLRELNCFNGLAL